MTTYCEFAAKQEKNDLHRIYHDLDYGFPMSNDNDLFGRLILEINQAGLSWITILKKKENLESAYDGFAISKVAQYGSKEKNRLLNDPGIIRNRLKVEAAINNAIKITEIQKEYGSFKSWLDHHFPLPKDEWVKLFKKNFKFTGGEIVNEFLVSTGYLPGAHAPSCPLYKKWVNSKPRCLGIN
jgi:DNA-3-methyladenine glycosylase I